MPAKPPKCKICDHEHWIGREPHVLPKEEPVPKPRPVSVTTPVTKPVTPITPPVTPRSIDTTPVTEEGRCVCPTCGAPHSARRYSGGTAERSRAYRARRSGNGQSD